MEPRGLIVIVAWLVSPLVAFPETKYAPLDVAVLVVVVGSGSPLAFVSGGVSARNVTVMVLRTPAFSGPRLLQVIVPPLTEDGASVAETYCSFALSKVSTSGSGSMVAGP